MATKPKTRKAPAKRAAPKAAPEMELDLPGRAKLTNAINLMALELNEYECGAICSVADAIKAKIGDGLDLIEAYKKESGLGARQVEMARKAIGLA
jgi:hypothetical protein